MAASRPASRSYALLLAAAATLAWNPRAWADPGWQLSFAAVAGILALGVPLPRGLRHVGEELAAAAGARARGGPVRSRRRPPAGRRRGHHRRRHARHRAAARAPLRLGAARGPAREPARPARPWPRPCGSACSRRRWGRPAAWASAAAEALGGLAGVRGRATSRRWPSVRRPARRPACRSRSARRAGRRLTRTRRCRSRCSIAAGLTRSFTGRIARAAPPAGAGCPRARRLALAAAVGARPARRRRPGPRRARPARTAHRPLPRRRPGRRHADPAPRRHGGALRRRAARGRGRAPAAQGGRAAPRAGRGHPPLARPPRRPGGGAAALPGRRAPRRRRRHAATRASAPLLREAAAAARPPHPRATRAARAHARRRRAAIRGSSRRRRGRPARRPEDPNPRAVVALVSAGGFDLLLSADAESEALLPLDLPDVDAMKVPHHGSADPGLPEVLDAPRPRAGRDRGRGEHLRPPGAVDLAALDTPGSRPTAPTATAR